MDFEGSDLDDGEGDGEVGEEENPDSDDNEPGDDDDQSQHPGRAPAAPSPQAASAVRPTAGSFLSRPSMPPRSQSTSALNGRGTPSLTPTNGSLHHAQLLSNGGNNVYGNAFAPPFYNRPPTPLPPSPSLTSLLRPAFSTATTSRPTTPDSSDVETIANEHEDVVAKSARHATTVARVSPKIPTYEYYGFVLYVGSSLAFREWCLFRVILFGSVEFFPVRCTDPGMWRRSHTDVVFLPDVKMPAPFHRDANSA